MSLAFTTYQTNRLFLVGVKPNGQLSSFERLFDRAMGLWTTPNHLYLSTRYQLWQFDNVLNPGQLYKGYDQLYVPRIAHTTGDLDIHDVVVVNHCGKGTDKKKGRLEQRVIFVNTLFSCLATLSDQYSFEPIWQPPFISKLTPEDRCHLNGLAMVEGKPRYVTAVSRSDVTGGWRERRQDGGVVMDIEANEVILTGLSMAHSPRFYRGKLWLLNSGTGEFGYLDLQAGQFEPVAFCPGYMRGLAFWGNYAVVGLSKPRDRSFSGLALDERLAAKDTNPRCGLMVIDLTTGSIAHWLELEGVVTELYDVQVLPGVRRPMALGFKSDEISRLVTCPGFSSFQGDLSGSQKAKAPRPPSDSALLTKVTHGGNPKGVKSQKSNARKQFERGKILTKEGSLETAVTCFQSAVHLQPDYVAAYNQLGNVLQALGKTDEAIAAFQQILQINPNVAEAYCNLGNIWQIQGKVPEAIAAYQQALQIKPNFPLADLNLANLLLTEGQIGEAEYHYQQATSLEPQNSEVQLHYGNCLKQLGRIEEAIACLRAAIKLQPNYVEAYHSLGQVLANQGNQGALELAESCYQRVQQLQPDYAPVLLDLGRLYDNQDKLALAADFYQKLLALKPEVSDLAFYELSYIRQRLCDWSDYENRMTELQRRTENHIRDIKNPTLSTLSLNVFPVPAPLHLAVARHGAKRIERNLAEIKARCGFRHSRETPEKLRLGYVSPDFRHHAMGILIQELFGYHNRDAFTIYAYSLRNREDSIAEKVKAGCDHFVDLSRLSTEEAARRIYDDNIQILIDLAGYTTYSRPEIFALQPAPIQCSYLGYPDTMGADFINYLITDNWVVPPELAAHYSETVIRLPHQFVASPLEIDQKPLTRAEVGLPEQGFVFCCFNNHRKITPEVFTVWMRILKRVPDSVLWLSAGADSLQANLQIAAVEQGVAAERLIFSPRLPLEEFLGRHRLADLFLDTFIYNAGATAICALTAGVPVLTKPGNTYTSRMGASICAAAGLDEMICHSVAAYEERAVYLATHPQELAAMGQQLQENRPQLPLFNLQQFVENLEAAYGQMWREYEKKLSATRSAEGKIPWDGENW